MNRTQQSGRDFRLFLAGEVTSAFGSSLTTTATAVIAVARLHASPAEVSLIVLSGTLPALAGPLCGVLADRVNHPRRFLTWLNVASAVMTLSCGLAAVAGIMAVGWLCALGFTIGLGELIAGSLYFTHLQTLDVGDLSQARAKLQSGESVARTVAASAAGPVAALLNPALLFLGDAVTYVISAASLRGLRSPDVRAQPPQSRGSLLHDLTDGLAAVRGHALIFWYLAYACLGTVAASAITAQRAVFLLDVVRLPVALYTVPGIAATLIGAIGSMFAARLLTRLGPRRVLILCSVAAPACGALLPAAFRPLPIALPMVAAATAFPVLFGMVANIALVNIVTTDIGERYFGRVGGLLTTSVAICGCVGTVLGGVVGTALGTRYGIWSCEGIYVLAVLTLILGLRRRGHGYPNARRGTDADYLHGIRVPDPYRWLEDPDAPDTQSWLAEQQLLADRCLGALPGRDKLLATMRAFAVGPARARSIEKTAGARLFRSAGATTTSPWHVEVREPGAEWRTVIDATAFGADAIVRRWQPSPSGRYLALQYTHGGDESATPLAIVDSGTGLVIETSPRTRYSSVEWRGSEQQYYYVRPHGERPGTGLYLHVVGADPAGDTLVIGDAQATTRYHAKLWHDRWLVVTVRQGTARDTKVYVADTAGDGVLVTAPVAGTAGAGALIDSRGTLIVPIFDGDGLGTVVRVSYIENSWRQPEVLIGADESAPVSSVRLVPTSGGDRLVVVRNRDGVSSMAVHDAVTGDLLTRVRLPGRGTVNGIGQADSSAIVISYTDWATPTSCWLVDLDTGQAVPGGEPPAVADIQETHVTCESPDGTAVPLTILSRPGAEAGPRPAFVTGYGGFGIPFKPTFQPDLLAWISHGGIVAIAGVRGGGERGRRWHLDGAGAKKPNAFADLHAAASWLIEHGWTEPGRLGLLGSSNGGLLAVGTMVQHPDAYAAVVGWAAPLDMIRYEHSGLGKAWRKEYGTPEDPAAFQALMSYSPYHNAARPAAYPAVLLVTGTADTRVDPLHSRKMAAQLQHASVGSGPVVLRVMDGVGHADGGGDDPALAAAAVLSFLAAHTGLEFPS